MNYRTKLLFLLVAVLTTLGSHPGPSSADDVELSRSQVETIKSTWIPAYEQGRLVPLVQAIRSQLARLDQDEINAVNQLLVGNGVPQIDQILVEARLPEIMQGEKAPTPIAAPVELVETLRGMTSYVDRIVEQVNKHAVMQDPLVGPESFDGYERLFWEVHVMGNQLTNAQQVATYANALSEVSQRRLRRNRLDEDQLRTIDEDFQRMAARVENLRKQLHERSVELRIYRIEDAYVTLDTSDDPKQRILAAYVMDTEGNQINQFFRSIANNENYRFEREGLNDGELQKSIAALVEEVQKTSGVTIEKGRLLMAGLHWWMRGRYGAGTHYYGLLKSPLAARNPAVRFALYMPIDRPRPTDPLDANSKPVPQYDRRHHYTWSYQDRQINVNVQSATSGYQQRELLDVKKSDEPVFW